RRDPGGDGVGLLAQKFGATVSKPVLAVLFRTPRINQIPALAGKPFSVERGLERLPDGAPELARGGLLPGVIAAGGGHPADRRLAARTGHGDSPCESPQVASRFGSDRAACG